MSPDVGTETGHADYDWRPFGRLLRTRLDADGRGYRALAHIIGVTSTDLSRVTGGQAVAAHKVIAICDWMEISFRAFYISPTISSCCSESHVKHMAGAND
jgi:hypothetical protein